jgi:hypothetical protein
MAAKVAGCCEGLVSSIDEVPTISEIMHKAIMDQTFPGGTVAFGSCTVPCYYQGVPPVNIHACSTSPHYGSLSGSAMVLKRVIASKQSLYFVHRTNI